MKRMKVKEMKRTKVKEIRRMKVWTVFLLVATFFPLACEKEKGVKNPCAVAGECCNVPGGCTVGPCALPDACGPGPGGGGTGPGGGGTGPGGGGSGPGGGGSGPCDVPGGCETECSIDAKPWFTAADVAKLKNRTVFFAHMSVGTDLMDGIRNLKTGIQVEQLYPDHTQRLAAIGSQTAFYELAMDSNVVGVDPHAKIREFVRLMNGISSADRLDIAFVKLGYPNFNRSSNVNDIFEHYRLAIQELEDTFRTVTFVHATSPLYKEITDDPFYNDDNTQIEMFNKNLRDAYPGQVFDLAKLESIRCDGSMATLKEDKTVRALADDWARDTGHLNEGGRKRFGGALIAFLAQVELRQAR